MDMSIINSNLENELIFSEKSIFLKIVKKLSKIIKESNNLILLKVIYLITQTSNRHYVKFNFFPYKFQIYLYISYHQAHYRKTHCCSYKYSHIYQYKKHKKHT